MLEKERVEFAEVGGKKQEMRKREMEEETRKREAKGISEEKKLEEKKRDGAVEDGIYTKKERGIIREEKNERKRVRNRREEKGR